MTVSSITNRLLDGDPLIPESTDVIVQRGKCIMTAVEHIIAWIESSRDHYERLVQLERDRKGFDARYNSSLAQRAFNIVTSAYSEAVRGGDMFAQDHSPETLLDAAKALLAWELEQ